jgi:uncharacterized membrane protein
MDETNLAALNLLASLAAALLMTGVIWLVQLAHYPLFELVGETAFPAYHAAHTRLISPVVIPPMLVELVTAALLLVWRPAGAPAWLLWLQLMLVLLAWGATFLLSVPYHNQLGTAAGHAREAAIAGLVATNWLRTLAWTARATLLLGLVGRMLLLRA